MQNNLARARWFCYLSNGTVFQMKTSNKFRQEGA